MNYLQKGYQNEKNNFNINTGYLAIRNATIAILIDLDIYPELCNECGFEHIYGEAEYDFVSGSTYSFDFAINGISKTGMLKIPYPIIINPPSLTFEHNKDFSLSWDVASNPNVQIVTFEWSNYVNDEYESYGKFIDSSLRSYTFPADCAPADWHYVRFMVFNLNYKVAGDATFISQVFNRLDLSSNDEKYNPDNKITYRNAKNNPLGRKK